MARPKKLDNQNLDELKATAEAKGIEVQDDDTEETLRDRLKADGVKDEDGTPGVDVKSDLDKQDDDFISPKAQAFNDAPDFRKQKQEAYKARQEEITEKVLPDFQGSGLTVHFDQDGSVTFKRGTMAESIHTSADDASIRRAAQRVTGVKIAPKDTGDLNYAY